MTGSFVIPEELTIHFHLPDVEAIYQAIKRDSSFTEYFNERIYGNTNRAYQSRQPDIYFDPGEKTLVITLSSTFILSERIRLFTFLFQQMRAQIAPLLADLQDSLQAFGYPSAPEEAHRHALRIMTGFALLLQPTYTFTRTLRFGLSHLFHAVISPLGVTNNSNPVQDTAIEAREAQPITSFSSLQAIIENEDLFSNSSYISLYQLSQLLVRINQHKRWITRCDEFLTLFESLRAKYFWAKEWAAEDLDEEHEFLTQRMLFLQIAPENNWVLPSLLLIEIIKNISPAHFPIIEALSAKLQKLPETEQARMLMGILYQNDHALDIFTLIHTPEELEKIERLSSQKQFEAILQRQPEKLRNTWQKLRDENEQILREKKHQLGIWSISQYIAMNAPFTCPPGLTRVSYLPMLTLLCQEEPFIFLGFPALPLHDLKKLKRRVI